MKDIVFVAKRTAIYITHLNNKGAYHPADYIIAKDIMKNIENEFRKRFGIRQGDNLIKIMNKVWEKF